MPRDSVIKGSRLKNKKELKAYLAPRYKGQIAHRIVKYFDFRIPIEFDRFLEQLEEMLNQNDNFFKMSFDIFDFDGDGFVSELDLYAIVKIYEFEDELFVKALARDLAQI